MKISSRKQSEPYHEPTSIEEIGEIFALGLMRLIARKSSEESAHFGDVSLDFSPDQSVDAPENGSSE